MNVACVELAHHLGVPAAVPGLATDAKYAGVQAGYEKALKGLATAGVGADVLSGGVGMIDSVNTLFLPQIVLDAEVVGMIRRMLGDVDTGRDEMMLDMIERVGIGGDFLKEKETARRLRAGEHFTPVVSSRQAYDQWVADGRDEVARAKERMEAALRRPRRARPAAGRRQAGGARRRLRCHARHGPRARPLSDADADTLVYIHLGGYTAMTRCARGA